MFEIQTSICTKILLKRFPEVTIGQWIFCVLSLNETIKKDIQVLCNNVPFRMESFQIMAELQLRRCTKILQKIMAFQKLAKTHFSQYGVIFQNNTLKISGKTYCHGNYITITTSSWFFFVQGSLRCKNNILLHFHLYCQCNV